MLRLMEADREQAFVEAAMQDPATPVQQLPITSLSSRDTILRGFNDTNLDYPSELCTTTLFKDRVKENPLAACIR